MTPQEKAFLEDLTELSRKHGIAVGGCGCGDSPFLYDIENSYMATGGYVAGDDGQNVQWVDPSDKYLWKKYSDKIIKLT